MKTYLSKESSQCQLPDQWCCWRCQQDRGTLLVPECHSGNSDLSHTHTICEAQIQQCITAINQATTTKMWNKNMHLRNVAVLYVAIIRYKIKMFYSAFKANEDSTVFCWTFFVTDVLYRNFLIWKQYHLILSIVKDQLYQQQKSHNSLRRVEPNNYYDPVNWLTLLPFHSPEKLSSWLQNKVAPNYPSCTWTSALVWWHQQNCHDCSHAQCT